ncbi:MAG: hypothetical protein ACK5AO_05700 [bacterium]|jgi:hypothetical protein
MRYIFLLLLSILFLKTYSQDDLLQDLLKDQDTTTDLLPNKMLITQRVLWGEKGLLRPISPLTSVNREKELKLRRTMLVAHQVLGFVTLGGMVGQGIVGSQLYKNPGDHRARDLHEGLAVTVNLTYSATAAMSLFAPPPLINRDKKLSAIRLHKWLSLVHMSGMIATNILADKAEDPKFKPYHRAAAFATFASFAAAVIVIKF